MNKFYKIALVLTMFSYYSLQGMSEKETNETPELDSLYSLKEIVANKIARALQKHEISEDLLSCLPEELQNYIKHLIATNQWIEKKRSVLFSVIKFHETNTDFQLEDIEETKNLLEFELEAKKQGDSRGIKDLKRPELKKLIRRTKIFWCRLADSKSIHLNTFILALQANISIFNLEKFLKIINILIARALDQTLNSSSNTLEKNDNIQKKAKFTNLEQTQLEEYAELALSNKEDHALALIVNLGNLPREFWLKMFAKICLSKNFSVRELKLLNSLVYLTKEEFESLLKPSELTKKKHLLRSSFKNLAQLKYLFELIEEFGLDGKKIINSTISNYFPSLLINAINKVKCTNTNIDLIKFFLVHDTFMK